MFNWFDEFKASVEAGIEAGFKEIANPFKNGIGEWFQVPEAAEVQLLLDTERDHYMNLGDIKIEQIKDYIHQEKAKGRTVQEIIKEIVTVRSDVTILSHYPMVAEKQMHEALKQ